MTDSSTSSQTSTSNIVISVVWSASELQKPVIGLNRDKTNPTSVKRQTDCSGYRASSNGWWGWSRLGRNQPEADSTEADNNAGSNAKLVS